MFRILILVVTLTLLCIQPAFSHTVWLQPKDGALKVMFGHGDKCDPYNPKFVKEVKGFDCKGQAVQVETIRKKDSVSISLKNKPAVVTVFWDAGYGMVTTEGWKKMPKREAEKKYKILKSFKLLRYNKALMAPCDTFSKPVGLAIEVVPGKDPFSVKPGESLPVTVLLNGKPLEGAEMSTYDSDPYLKSKPKTDKNGKVEMPIKAGFNLIHAGYKAPLKDDPDADTIKYGASLSFTVK